MLIKQLNLMPCLNVSALNGHDELRIILNCDLLQANIHPALIYTRQTVNGLPDSVSVKVTIDIL